MSVSWPLGYDGGVHDTLTGAVSRPRFLKIIESNLPTPEARAKARTVSSSCTTGVSPASRTSRCAPA